MTPLGIPEGSVRSILALIVIGAAVFVWVTNREMSDFQQFVTASVMAYYYASRAAEGKTNTVLPPVNLDAVDLLKKVENI